MAHGLVELLPLGKDLLVGVVQVVGLEDVGRVFFHHAAGEYLVDDEEQRDDGHVDDEGVDLPDVQEVVVDDREQPEDGEEENDELDQDAGDADGRFLLVEELSDRAGTMKTKLSRRTHTSM